MRSSKSRSRSKANRPRTLGNIINRVFDSSGPEGKVRGTPQQIIEKYQFLARDAQLSNDRVAAENFNQHAEHYTRMLAEATREMAAEQEARQQQYGQGGQPQGQGGQNSNGNGNGNGGQPQQGHGGGQQGNNQSRPPREDRDYRDNRQDRDHRDARDNRGDRDYRSDDRVPTGIDVVETEDDLGLVETPEARPQHQPQPQSKPRAERPRRDDLPAFVTAALPKSPAPLTAEPPPTAEAKADRGPRRPRAPRKPKEDAGTNSAE
jgi:Domain of unknown function (DUF4167)